MKKWFTLVVAVSLLGFTACTGSSEKKSEGAKGKDGETLKLEKISDVSLKPGEETKFKVTIKREKFDDPVAVVFKGLPDDVKLMEDNTKFDKGTNEREFTLKADKSAKTAKTTVEATAEAKDMKHPQKFTVEVKK
jgi:uncharacterized cupredoxin-like copper-binding protein